MSERITVIAAPELLDYQERWYAALAPEARPGNIRRASRSTLEYDAPAGERCRSVGHALTVARLYLYAADVPELSRPASGCDAVVYAEYMRGTVLPSAHLSAKQSLEVVTVLAWLAQQQFLEVVLLQVDERRPLVPGFGQQVELEYLALAKEDLAEVPHHAAVHRRLAAA